MTDTVTSALEKLKLEKLGNTSLLELKNLGAKNGNRLFAKVEYENPSGNLYDRVYVRLLQRHLEVGNIVPGQTHIIETTSGNAGTAIARIATRLGFQVTVIVPADTPIPRLHTIENYGANLELSPKGKYVRGAVRQLQSYLAEHKIEVRDHRLFCLNHSRDPLSLDAVAPIADEIVGQLAEIGTSPDVIVLGCGNGTTILGIGERLKELVPHARCVAFDPIEAPVAYERKYPGRFEAELGMDVVVEPHRIIGTGGLGVRFPFIEDPRFLQVVDDVELVHDEDMMVALHMLNTAEHRFPGYSSAAAVSVALKLSEYLQDKTIVTLFYDEDVYYDISEAAPE